MVYILFRQFLSGSGLGWTKLKTRPSMSKIDDFLHSTGIGTVHVVLHDRLCTHTMIDCIGYILGSPLASGLDLN